MKSSLSKAGRSEFVSRRVLYLPGIVGGWGAAERGIGKDVGMHGILGSLSWGLFWSWAERRTGSMDGNISLFGEFNSLGVEGRRGTGKS